MINTSHFWNSNGVRTFYFLFFHSQWQQSHTELKAPVNEPAALWLAPPDTCPCIRRRAEQDWIIHLVTSVCGGQNCCWLCSHILHLWAGFVFFLSSSEGFLLYSSLIWGEWLFNKLLCDACQDRLTSMWFFFFFFLAGIPSIPGVHRREGKTWWVLFPYVFQSVFYATKKNKLNAPEADCHWCCCVLLQSSVGARCRHALITNTWEETFPQPMKKYLILFSIWITFLAASATVRLVATFSGSCHM